MKERQSTLRLIELSSFQPEQGKCWIASLPLDCVDGDDVGRASSSELLFFEDGLALGPWRSVHDNIRANGNGAYSHWRRDLWFSTSDNSNPATNGRKYVAIVPSRVREGESRNPLFETGSPAPVNYQSPVATPEALEADARYAMTVADSYVNLLPGGSSHLSGRSVLELGPGQNFGAALTLLCWGADRVAVADRFIAPFERDYHAPLYSRLAELLRQRGNATSLSPIEDCIAAGGHITSRLFTHEVPLEALSEAIDVPFDVTVSNAVLEHLFNPFQAIHSLYKITAEGGFGLHQVDFRDHRNFSLPLEFLLEDERGFGRLFEEQFGQTGSRVRPFQMEHMFRVAGFSRVEFVPNMMAPADYLESFMTRLRASVASPYYAIDSALLEPISGRFIIHKVTLT